MEKIDPILKSKNLKFIYFAGGEPLITENHYKVLERLIELKKKPSLWYNTNFSTLSYKKYNLIKMWKKLLIKPPWTNISLSISLDGMEKRGHRHGRLQRLRDDESRRNPSGGNLS